MMLVCVWWVFLFKILFTNISSQPQTTALFPGPLVIRFVTCYCVAIVLLIASLALAWPKTRLKLKPIDRCGHLTTSNKIPLLMQTVYVTMFDVCIFCYRCTRYWDWYLLTNPQHTHTNRFPQARQNMSYAVCKVDYVFWMVSTHMAWQLLSLSALSLFAAVLGLCRTEWELEGKNENTRELVV